MNDAIVKAVREAAVDGMLSCVDAHDIAAQLGVSPLEVGKVVNKATDLRFYRCQLGLFGYGPKPEGLHKIVLKAAHVPEEIEAAVRERTVKGRISCRAVWEIADQFKYPRLGIANIIEALDINLAGCQLGCF